MLDFLKAAFLGGGLTVVITLGFYYRLFHMRTIAHDGGLRQLKRDAKQKIREHKKNKAYGFVEKRWMRFGAGYYGIMVLLTLLIIELNGAFVFFTDIEAMREFISSLGLGTLIDFIINQAENVTAAIFWFFYWLDYFDNGYFFVWLLFSYVGYLSGIHFAREISRKKQADTAKIVNKTTG